MPLARWFGWQGAFAGALALLIAAGLWLSLTRQVADQEARVHFLKGEVAKLDREIAEVSQLRDQIGQVLARKAIAEALQVERPKAVRLLDELARQRPAGVRLTAVREEGARLFIAGAAASERETARFFDALSGSPLLEGVQLLEVRAGRFSVAAGVRGGQALAGASAPRYPSDVHPGDPK